MSGWQHPSQVVLDNAYYSDDYVYVQTPKAGCTGLKVKLAIYSQDENQPLGLASSQKISIRSFLEAIQPQELQLLDVHWMPQFGCFERYTENSKRLFVDFLGGEHRPSMRLVDRHATGAEERLDDHYSPYKASLVRSISRHGFEAFGWRQQITDATDEERVSSAVG